MVEITIDIDKKVEVIEDPLQDVSQLRKKENIDLFSWWQQANGGEIPDWKEFDIIDFASLSNRLTLTQRHPEGYFQFKIQGENTLDILGRRRLQNAKIYPDHESEYERNLYRYYDQLCVSGKPYVFRGSLPTLERDYLDFESVDLPFRGKDGEVNIILSLLIEID